MKKTLFGSILVWALTTSLISCRHTADKANEASEQTIEVLEKTGQDLKEIEENTLDKTKEVGEEVIETTKEFGVDAKNAAEKAGNKIQKTAQVVKDSLD